MCTSPKLHASKIDNEVLPTKTIFSNLKEEQDLHRMKLPEVQSQGQPGPSPGAVVGSHLAQFGFLAWGMELHVSHLFTRFLALPIVYKSMDLGL